MKFLAFLVFRFLPKPKYQFWLPEGGANYTTFYQRCEALAIKWLRSIHWEMDDEYRNLLIVLKADEPLPETIGESFCRHYPNFAKPAQRSEHVIYWQHQLATLAGDISSHDSQ